MNRNARDAVFGMSRLPDKSGAWGRLLGYGKEPRELEPASVKSIQSINDSFMVFARGVQASSRGFAFVLGLAIGCAGYIESSRFSAPAIELVVNNALMDGMSLLKRGGG